jgi:hypothetical protein
MDEELSPEAQAVVEDASAVVAAVAEIDPDLAEAVAAVVEDALALADVAAPDETVVGAMNEEEVPA